MDTPAKKVITSYLGVLLALGIVVAVGVWAIFVRSRTSEVPPPQLSEEGYHYRRSQEGQLLFFKSETDAFAPAEDIQQQFDGPEWLNAFVLPQGNGGFYLSSDEYTQGLMGDFNDPCVSMNRIYHYDSETQALQKVYEEESRDGSPMMPNKCRILRLAGLYDGKPVLLVDDPDNSPGICTNIWGGYPERFVVLTNGRLEKFTVPPEKVTAGLAEQEKCLQEMVP